MVVTVQTGEKGADVAVQTQAPACASSHPASHFLPSVDIGYALRRSAVWRATQVAKVVAGGLLPSDGSQTSRGAGPRS